MNCATRQSDRHDAASYEGVFADLFLETPFGRSMKTHRFRGTRYRASPPFDLVE